jgi:hypothetical protein
MFVDNDEFETQQETARKARQNGENEIITNNTQNEEYIRSAIEPSML